MAKIFGLELRNVKVVTVCFWADLYLNDKKIASCDYCGEDSPYVSVKWERDMTTNDIEESCIALDKYFEKYPKYLTYDYNIVDCQLTEIICELLTLHENEQELIKAKIKYPKAKMVHIAYNKRTEPLTKLDDWVCLTEWSGNLEDRIRNTYHPLEFTIFNEEKDFIIAN